MGRHGENIHKRKDNRWEARLLILDPETGKKKYRYFYGDTYADAKQKKEAAIVELYHKSNMAFPEFGFYTFCDLTNQWLIHKKKYVKSSTLSLYQYYLEQYILPYIGERKLKDLEENALNDLLNAVQNKHSLSHKTIADIRSVLRMILNYAKSHGVLADVVLDRLNKKQQPRKKIQVLTPSEQKRLEAYIRANPSRTSIAIWLSLFCGLRIGEVCALTWADFNFQDHFFHINKTLERIYTNDSQGKRITKIVIQSAKTAASERILPISDELYTILQGFDHDESCYLLTGSANYMEPRTLLRRYKKILEYAEISDHTYHCLRHTFATRCIEQQADVKVVSEIMGHSNVTITMQRYVHPSFNAKKDLLNKITGYDQVNREKENIDTAENTNNSIDTIKPIDR